ncbi:mitochondrial ribosomal protein subunit domain-containing protein [Sarocladium implicatum]|nr:mitochondrial ribosomal protein subunit domain-containing protein [Sarocladium implicatum]
MSGRAAASPGGQLLRTSRLFSVPKPLSEPQTNAVNLGLNKSSTMTKAYPTHQTFTTPKSSRELGDWGFKRPFPLRTTTKSSTPLLRIKQVDTVENVTDFASAADLSLTLEKFQEMRVAPVLPDGNDRYGTPVEQRKGVFEEDMDITDLAKGEGTDRKWKFEGPWLARMDEGSFERYLNTAVRPKRQAFRHLLKLRLLEDKNRAQASLAQENGRPPPEPLELESIAEGEFFEYLRTLRNHRPTLYTLVADFLDLAPLTTPVGIVDSLKLILDDYQPRKSPYGISGAPRTHPSAGLGYLRTNAVMENHPVFGPQRHRTPVQARILYPKSGTEPAKLGVGGMVTEAPRGDNSYNTRYGAQRRMAGVDRLDVSTRGGAKGWVEPQGVVIDPSGSAVLQIKEANQEARFVASENSNPGIVYHDTKKGSNDSDSKSQRLGRVADELLKESDSAVDSSTVKSTPQWYGLVQ